MSTACPDPGTLRAYLDGEAGPQAADHAEGCPRCAAALERLRTDAAVASRALALLEPGGPGQASAPGEASAPAGAPAELDEQRRARATGDERRQRPRLRRLAAAATVAVAALATLGTPLGREAAASFLSQFRGERIQVVTIDPYGERNPLTALSALGTIDADPQAGMIQPAGSLAEAERRTGLDVTRVPAGTIPASFAQEPAQVAFAEASEVRIAFDDLRVRAWLDEHGSDLDVPGGIGDTVLAVQLPPAVAQVFRGENFEELVVGQSGLVTATTEGPVELGQLRDFLLDLPGLPPGVVEQLSAIDDWRTTLPLPVPVHELDWRDTTVGGAPAVELRGTSGFGSALLWQHDGVVHGVGGLVDEGTARRIAESLAP